MRSPLLFLLLLSLNQGIIYSQTAHEYLRVADKAYEKSEYDKAAALYEGADSEDPSAQAKYNKGNALYQMGKLEEAAKIYEESLQQADDENLKFRNYHNLGNVYSQQNDFQKAVDAYKNALKVNPNDIGTKKNLVRALRQIPPEQQQKQEQQQQSSDQQKKDESKKEQDQQASPNEQQKQDSKENAESPSSIAQRDLSEEEMQRLLKAVENEDQSVQKKLKRKTENQSSRPVKDW